MQSKTERFEMRLDQAILDNVDAWRARQADVPSRAEAVRRLIEDGLATTSGRPVRLSDGEKLTIFMLLDLYKHLKVKGDMEPEFLEAAIGRGHNWALSWKYPGIFHGQEIKERVVHEVGEVLDMWELIETAYRKLSKKDKDRVAKEAEPFGKNVKFPGFCGNYESEYLSVAGFLVNHLERFETFKGRDLNSHAPLLGNYRRMLTVFEPVRRNFMGGGLSTSTVIELLYTMVPPENRKQAK